MIVYLIKLYIIYAVETALLNNLRISQYAAL